MALLRYDLLALNTLEQIFERARENWKG